MLLVSLVGEQPAPNLLSARALRPEVSILVCTERTKKIAERLRGLLLPICPCGICIVDGYNIAAAQLQLTSYIDDYDHIAALHFNVTGGTKPMSLAAFMLAKARNAPFSYFQTEGNRSRLLSYGWRGEKVELTSDQELAVTISIDDYLQLYLGEYESGPPREEFERQVYATFQQTSEIECLTSVRPKGLSALEVDFVLRCGNQIGVGEAKRKGAKSGIDQINAVADPRYLGTYIHKFLFSGTTLDINNRELAKAYNITLIELPTYKPPGEFSNDEQAKLVIQVLTRMKP
ncbi:MAG TPA: DUF1887 family CARF protein [Caldilineaceae bacterium]|nr:DUF1887 family CARF protein [Caldilineaceae bacterium]